MKNKIICKNCKHENNINDLLLDSTMWGEAKGGYIYCNNCGHIIEIKEFVNRTWKVI